MNACNQFGVFPISFSHPKALPLRDSIDSALSYITPGFPYSFDDEDEYLEQYNKFALGLTHRKAGWDCFRHVEILAAGAVPLMPDVQEVPVFSMVHYPKTAMHTVVEQFRLHGRIPSKSTRENFRRYFLRNLSTTAMARYVLKMAGVSENSKVLFLDEHTPTNPEYLSTLTFIGLKEVLKHGLEVAFPAEFLYQDSQTRTDVFYGRGFGYTKVLDPALRTAYENSGQSRALESLIDSSDVVILGSVSRNRRLADELLNCYADKKKIFLHGEDSPPDKEDYARLTKPGVVGFVRSIDRE